MTPFKCGICRATFDSIPRDAIQLGKSMGVRRLFRFADGTIHDIYSTKVGSKKKATIVAEEKK